MTVSQHDAIDFTMMYVTHAALRRDVGQLAAASAAGRAGTPRCAPAGRTSRPSSTSITAFEDDDLWPRLYRAVADRPSDLSLLKEMEHEHAILDPLLASVDDVLTRSAAAPLDERLQELTAALEKHLKHEEDSALPLIQSVLTPKDWRGFAAAMRRRQGYTGAAIYIPWLVDGAPPAERKRLLAAFPPPARMINRLVWEPRYRQLNLWAI
jgi:Hemerythrin HHE cation binding domain